MCRETIDGSMADNHEVITVSGFTSHLLQGLYSMQQRGELCDTQIHTAGGIVPAHRIVLMAGSMFFKCKEDQQNVPNFCHTNTYLMSELKADVENIVCFLYLGRVCVSQENADRLIKLGSFLQLHSMVEVCKSYTEKYRNVEPLFNTFHTRMKTADSNCLNNTGFFMGREHLDQNVVDKVTNYATGQGVTVESNDTSLNVGRDKSKSAMHVDKIGSNSAIYHPNAMDSVNFEEGTNDTSTFSTVAKTLTDHLFQQDYTSSLSASGVYGLKQKPVSWQLEQNQPGSNSHSCATGDHQGQSFYCDLCFAVFADEKNFDLHRKDVHAEIHKSFDSHATDSLLSECVNTNQPSVTQEQQNHNFDITHNALVNETSENSCTMSPSDSKRGSISGDEKDVVQTAVNKASNQRDIQENVDVITDASHDGKKFNKTTSSKTVVDALPPKHEDKNIKQAEPFLESLIVDKPRNKLKKPQGKGGRFSNSKVQRNKHLYDINKIKNKIPKTDNTRRSRLSTNKRVRKIKSENIKPLKRSVKELRSESVKFVCKSKRKRKTSDNAISNTDIASQEGGTKPFVCRRCMKSFSSHQERSEHIKSAHAGGIVVCNICNFSFKNVDWKYLMEHRYKKHNQMLETDKCPVYSCTEQGCGYKTLFKARYKIHMDLVHLKERLFNCTECQKSFKCQKNLNVHQRTHLDNYVREVFQCEQCGKKFKANSSLKRHIEKVHEKIDEAKQLCHLCTYQASNYRSMHNHLLKAHGIQPPKHVKVYQCSKCDFITLTKSHLSEHEGGHGGSSSQYVCQVCGKIFYTERRLNNHSKIHTAEELSCPYDECNFHCKEKKNLRRHIQRQHDPMNYKPYGCPHCNYFCKEKGNLNKHITGKHKVEVVTLYKLRQKAMETGKGYPNISCNEYPSGPMSSMQETLRL